MTFFTAIITETPSPLPTDPRFTFVRFTHPLPCGGVVQVDRCVNGPGEWQTERVRAEAVEQLRRAFAQK
jgi:hypothetical protein